MAQILVRQIEDDVKAKLQQRARSHGRSTEEEVREILRNSVRDEQTPPAMLGSRIAARFAKVGLDEDIPELRNQPFRPAELGEDVRRHLEEAAAARLQGGDAGLGQEAVRRRVLAQRQHVLVQELGGHEPSPSCRSDPPTEDKLIPPAGPPASLDAGPAAAPVVACGPVDGGYSSGGLFPVGLAVIPGLPAS